MRTRSAGRNLFSRNTVLSFFGVLSFLVLGLLGTHLHGADPVPQISQSQPSLVGVSGVVSTPELANLASESVAMAAAAAVPHVDVGPAQHAFQGIASLDIITACMLALIMALVLVAFSLRRSGLAVRADGAAAPLPATRISPTPSRPLFLLHSISRT